MIDFASYFNSIFLGSLRSLCDVEWQRRGWGEEDDPSGYVGFDEIVMEFMNACEVVLASPKKYHLSANQRVFIKKIFVMLNEYYSKYNNSRGRQMNRDPVMTKRLLMILIGTRFKLFQRNFITT